MSTADGFACLKVGQCNAAGGDGSVQSVYACYGAYASGSASLVATAQPKSALWCCYSLSALSILHPEAGLVLGHALGHSRPQAGLA